MIFDSIQNKDNYKEFKLLSQALDYLASLTPKTYPDSTVVFLPDRLYANPVSLVSKPETDCIFEAHQKYLDLHYILEGCEGIATADVSSLAVQTPYSTQKDIGFYTGSEEGRYYLHPGQFMVCWPNDAHKVAIMKDQPAPIRKIVVKIAAE